MKTYPIGQRLAGATVIGVLALVIGVLLGAFARWIEVAAWVAGGLLALGVLWPPALMRAAAGIGAAAGAVARFFYRPRAT